MAWLVVVLLLLVALGNLFDFLIGPPGQRRRKDRLVEWYVVIAGGRWTGIVQSSARTMNRFLNHLLGTTNLSNKGVLRASIIGMILMFSVVVISLGIHFPFVKFMASDRKVLLWNSFNIVCIVVANVALDVISLFFDPLCDQKTGANKHQRETSVARQTRGAAIRQKPFRRHVCKCLTRLGRRREFCFRKKQMILVEDPPL